MPIAVGPPLEIDSLRAPVGFGEDKPLVRPEKTEQDRARNRRVDFFVAREKGKRSTLPADGGGHVAGDLETDHAAIAAHLPPGDLVVGVAG